jgi:hypothetical protein
MIQWAIELIGRIYEVVFTAVPVPVPVSLNVQDEGGEW